MEIYGVSAPGVNASLAVIKDDQISFAAFANTYWRTKSARVLKPELITDCLGYAEMPTVIAMDERPMRTRLRHLLRGDVSEAFNPVTLRDYLGLLWGEDHIDRVEVAYYDRHYSLACAGYFTSTFREAGIVVIDGTRMTIWDAQDRFLAKVFDQTIPGSDVHSLFMISSIDVFQKAWELTQRRNLAFVGDGALRPQDNALFASMWDFSDVWVLPNPVASSLGAALAYRNEWVEWATPFLGADAHRKTDTSAVLSALEDGKPVGLVQGRAEFTPHSMGGRTLLGDPRSTPARRRVRDLTGDRGPLPVAILAEHVSTMFHEDNMAAFDHGMFAAQSKMHREIGSNWTARALAVTPMSNPLLHDILSEWYRRTGYPMLLNAPLCSPYEATVNNWKDALEFSRKYRVEVF